MGIEDRMERRTMKRGLQEGSHGRSVLFTVLVAVVAGCGSAPRPASSQSDTTDTAERPAASPESSLLGTAWQLVEFQSMDDAIGTTRPDDPTVYTMRLEEDGTVTMQLNCNRATGSWSADPGADGASGSFGFGPLAMTRALCPPPSLDEEIAAQAPYVRSYLLRDGRLYLSLMADGGIYVWEPRD